MSHEIVLFMTSKGEPIRIVEGKLDDPDKYEDASLPKDFTWRKIERDEAIELFPPPPHAGRMTDSMATQLRQLHGEHDALLDFLEGELKLTPGSLKTVILRKAGLIT